VTSATATVLVVFGRGLILDEGCYKLTPASAARVRATADYVGAHEEIFVRATSGSRPPRIVFSGGWPEASEGADPPPAGYREGNLMLHEAREIDLEKYADLCAETRSRSTLENVLHTIGAGLLEGYQFTSRYPLGIVAHPSQLPRIRFLIRKVLGLGGEDVLDVPAQGADNSTGWLSERVVNLASHLCALGVRDPETLLRRERQMVASVRRVERIAVYGSRKRRRTV
jgi:hypothetical protein